jgi:hypothetical protein
MQRFNNLGTARNGDVPLRTRSSEYDCDLQECRCDLDIMALWLREPWKERGCLSPKEERGLFRFQAGQSRIDGGLGPQHQTIKSRRQAHEKA